MTKTAAPRKVTVEARIWGVSETGIVKLYLGQRPTEGVQQFRTRIPVSDSDQANWFQITLEDNQIVGLEAL